jgi:hypothetical protein
MGGWHLRRVRNNENNALDWTHGASGNFSDSCTEDEMLWLDGNECDIVVR